MSRSIDLDGWQFTPGPRHLDEPILTTDCFEVVEHPLGQMLTALAALPEVEPAAGSYRWRGIVLQPEIWFGDIWGRTRLSGRGSVEELMTVWEHLRSRLEGVWLFQAGVEPDLLWTPEAFARLINTDKVSTLDEP